MMRNLAKGVGVAFAAALLVVWVLSEDKDDVITPIASATAAPSPWGIGVEGQEVAHDLPATSSTPTTDDGLADSDAGHVSYAVSLVELPGLPPDAGSGTTFDIWVTWEPPITKGPRVQLLLRDAVLERIAEPLTREGPFVAVIAVADRHLSDLIYGDRYGDLSAAVSVTQVQTPSP